MLTPSQLLAGFKKIITRFILRVLDCISIPSFKEHDMTTPIVRKQLHENELESQLIHVREPIVQVSLDLLFLVTALVAPGEYLVNAIARRIGTLYALHSNL